MLAFDLGSYKGEFSDYLYSEGYNVIAVDPLNVNESINNTYIKAVVSSNKETKKLWLNTNRAICSINKDFVNNSRFSKSVYYNSNSYTNEFIRIDSILYEDLVKEYGTPDLVKIDVEGSELDVINSIETFPEIICFEFHIEFKDDTEKILEILKNNKYKFFNIQDFSYIEECYKIPRFNLLYNDILSHINKDNRHRMPWQLSWGMIWAKKNRE